MKFIKNIIISILLIFAFGACVNVSTHPILRHQKDLMATEVRVNIYVSDDIQSARINNFSLKAGSNYLKVPIGTSILYWSKKGKTYSRSIDVNKSSDQFLIF